MTQQHHQGGEDRYPRASLTPATQPGDPGAVLNLPRDAAPGKLCSSCGHTMSMNMCWRLTCPSRGAGISAILVRGDGVLVEVVRSPLVLTRQGEELVKRSCAEAARRVMRSDLFDPPPPDKASAFVFDEDDDDA